jgi:putative lysine transport system substrate-binding protein
MQKMKKMITLVLCFAMFASLVVLTGCSSDKKEASKKVLKVGMECGYAPFNWTQTTDANGAVKIAGTSEYAYGYDVIMAKKLAESMGYDLEIHKIEWDGLAPAVSTGKVDAVIAGMSITSKRKESVDFSSVYYNASIVALTQKDSSFANAKSVADLQGAVATSQLNTIWYDLIKQIPDAKIQPAIDNVPGMIVALTSGKVQVLVLDKPTAMAAAFSNPNLVMLDFKDGKGFEASQEDVEMGIAVKKGNSDLLKQLNEKLGSISEGERNKMMEEAIQKQPLSK